jgi:hypothetical protein
MQDSENRPPSIESSLEAKPEPRRLGNVAAARARLDNYLAASHALGDEAEEEYARSLGELRADPQSAVVEIAQALGACDTRDFPKRSALIFAACELRHPAALALLVSIVETPIPPEPADHSHAFSTAANETALRTTAEEGIGHLAKGGDPGALEALFRFVEMHSISIQRAAVQAILLTNPDPSIVERLKRELPARQHFLFSLETPKVEEVQQVTDPTRHLAENIRGVEPAAPPDPVGRAKEPPTPPTRHRRSDKERGR